MKGKKNHFTLLGALEASKFDYIYGLKNKDDQQVNLKKKGRNEFEFSEAEEDPTDLHEKLGIELEDIHSPSKVILQR